MMDEELDLTLVGQPYTYEDDLFLERMDQWHKNVSQDGTANNPSSLTQSLFEDMVCEADTHALCRIPIGELRRAVQEDSAVPVQHIAVVSPPNWSGDTPHSRLSSTRCEDEVHEDDAVLTETLEAANILLDEKESHEVRRAFEDAKSDGNGHSGSAVEISLMDEKIRVPSSLDEDSTPTRPKKRRHRPSDFVKGNWTKEEDDMLLLLVDKYGAKQWSYIASQLRGRIGKQCRERYYNHLDPALKRGWWTQEEDKMIIRLHGEVGNQWSYISKHMDGRTANGIKNHWHSTLKSWVQRLREEGKDPMSDDVEFPCPKRRKLGAKEE